MNILTTMNSSQMKPYIMHSMISRLERKVKLQFRFSFLTHLLMFFQRQLIVRHIRRRTRCGELLNPRPSSRVTDTDLALRRTLRPRTQRPGVSRRRRRPPLRLQGQLECTQILLAFTHHGQ
jgi:hypothetical protein